jgi:hypothetical protein
MATGGNVQPVCLFFFRLNARKINAALAVAAAAFFCKYVFVHHATNIKQGSGK